MVNFFLRTDIKKRICCFCAFVIAFLFVLALYKTYQYAPFGERALTWEDANIQYLDFFAFLKDAIRGGNSIRYTFSSSLGGTYYGVFSNYLSSPLNLLIVFFEKTQLHSFFDLIVALKIALAAMAAAYYLRIRFRLPFYIILCLSFSYAFSQYNFAQASNIMWLDGVYLLPVILAGVYKNLFEPGSRLLSVAAAFSIIFNWYSAGINCLFSVFYFILEFFLLKEEKNVKLFMERLFRYVCAMLIGISLSAFLFLPTVALLRNGVGKGFDWNNLSVRFNGNVFSVIKYYVIGATSSKTHVALYCGSLPLIGCLLLNHVKSLEKKKKVILNITLLAVVLLFYWQPFFLLFSLLKNASSFWFRYSYIGIFSLLFVAAHFYEKAEFDITAGTNIKPIVCFVAGLLILNYKKQAAGWEYIGYTVALLLIVYFCLRKIHAAKDDSKWFTLGLVSLLITVTLAELWINGKQMLKRYHYENISHFAKYEENTQMLIDKIKEYDEGIFRISQTSARSANEKGLTAHYNESAAFNYPSIASYTSLPDNMQMAFLERLGYRTEFERIKIVNTSVIGADSLLGVKYILSRYPIQGLEEITQLRVSNYSKKVYLNKYALPMAFTLKKNNLPTEHLNFSNPFEYQNALYRHLTGKPIKLYKPIPYIRKQQKSSLHYILAVPSEECVVYGNIPWDRYMEGSIHKGNKKITAYSTWLSPSVFYIPVSDNEKNVRVELRTKKDLSIRDEQFYALDLRALDELSLEIKSREVKKINIENGDISCIVDGSDEDTLFLSVPYHKGWYITRNGEKIEPARFGDCLMLLPLQNGVNKIEMHYNIPYLREGIWISVFGLLCLFAYGKLFKIRLE